MTSVRIEKERRHATISQPVGARPAGKWPWHVFFDRAGSKAYVADAWFTIVDVETAVVLATVTTGRTPWTILFAPDNGRAYLVNRGGPSISTLGVATDRIFSTLPISAPEDVKAEPSPSQ